MHLSKVWDTKCPLLSRQRGTLNISMASLEGKVWDSKCPLLWFRGTVFAAARPYGCATMSLSSA